MAYNAIWGSSQCWHATTQFGMQCVSMLSTGQHSSWHQPLCNLSAHVPIHEESNSYRAAYMRPDLVNQSDSVSASYIMLPVLKVQAAEEDTATPSHLLCGRSHGDCLGHQSLWSTLYVQTLSALGEQAQLSWTIVNSTCHAFLDSL